MILERLQMAIVWRLPRWLVYWAAVRVGAHATTGEHGDTDPTEMPFMTALKRWRPAGKGQST